MPVHTGSIAELNVVVEHATTADEVKEAFRKAAATVPVKGVMVILEDEWASSSNFPEPIGVCWIATLRT